MSDRIEDEALKVEKLARAAIDDGSEESESAVQKELASLSKEDMKMVLDKLVEYKNSPIRHCGMPNVQIEKDSSGEIKHIDFLAGKMDFDSKTVGIHGYGEAGTLIADTGLDKAKMAGIERRNKLKEHSGN